MYRCLCLVLLLTTAVAATPAPAPTRTAPPTIYRVYSRPMCSELTAHVLPAVAMILQDDRTIAKSQPVFKDYIRTGLVPNKGPAGGDTTDYASAGRTMALQNMEALVTPLAQNIIAIQKILENSSLARPSGAADDDKQLQAARQALLKALGTQSTSLDLIDGFVTTQQLGDIQHAGTEFLSAIQTNDMPNGGAATMSTPTPNPFQDPNQIGVPGGVNPYEVDPTRVPGLQVGWNQVSMISDGLAWVQSETSKRETAAASAVGTIAKACGLLHSASPAP